MKRDYFGCLAMLVLIPAVLALLVGIWWVVGYLIVHCINYLAQ